MSDFKQDPSSEYSTLYAEDLKVASDLAHAGVPIFVALPRPEPGAFFLPPKWQYTKPDAAVVDSWKPGMALAAVCGPMGHFPGFDVVDIDPRNGGDISALEGLMPTVYAVTRTPRGGTHHWIRSLGIGKYTGFLPGIDLQGGKPDGSGRSFVFLPPTYRPSGRLNPDGSAMVVSYLWEPGKRLSLPDTAARLSQDLSGGGLTSQAPKLYAETRSSGGGAHTGTAPAAGTTSGVVGRLPEYFKHGIPSGEQHDVLRGLMYFWVASGLDAMSSRIVARAILDVSPQDPNWPWTDSDIRLLYDSAKEKYRGEDLENLKTVYTMQGMSRDQADKTAKAFETYTAREEAKKTYEAREAEKAYKPVPRVLFHTNTAETKNKPMPDTKWVFEDMAGVGENILIVAKYKTGKTSLLVNIIKSLADGNQLFGKFNVSPEVAGMNFFYWNLEMTERMYQDYIIPLNIQNDFKGPSVHLRGHMLPFMKSPSVFNDIVSILREYRTDVWIIDTWRILCGWNGIDPTDNAAVEELIQYVDAIKHEAGVQTLFVSSHTPKYTIPGEEASALGAQGLMGWADSYWVLSRDDKDKNIRYLSSEGRHDFALDSTRIYYNPATHLITLTDELKADRARHRRDQEARRIWAERASAIYEFLSAHPGATTNEIKDATNLNGKIVNEIITYLVTCGVVVRTKDGRNIRHTLTGRAIPAPPPANGSGSGVQN